jgi:hypothetical protein
MLHTKSLVVGAATGILSMLLGLSVAKAECSRDADDFNAAVDAAHELCDAAAQSWLEDDGLTVEVIGGQHGMWEACVRLNTPVGPLLSAAQHYDTEDGAFWRVGR